MGLQKDRRFVRLLLSVYTYVCVCVCVCAQLGVGVGCREDMFYLAN